MDRPHIQSPENGEQSHAGWSMRSSGALAEPQRDTKEADLLIREGRFQRWLALVAGLSSVLSGVEVSYEHFKGSYNRRIMYSPVILSGALLGAGVWAFRSRRGARSALPAISALTLIDCAAGFYFHIRGIARKPGGWRLPITNIVMGPPICAPLLFGTSAYLGMVAFFLRRDDDPGARGLPQPANPHHWIKAIKPLQIPHETIGWEQDLREGRFQKHMATAAGISALLSGFEAWYSHYKDNFRYKAQWTPVIVAPILFVASAGAIRSPRIARTLLPAASALAMLDGTAGFGYHARGIMRRPGGLKKPLYNLMYGPPIFAPLLFAAAGFLGLMASLLRREKES